MKGRHEVSKSEPVITVYADGLVLPGPGYSIGDVLSALDAARRAVLGIVLRQPDETPEETDE